MYDNIQPAMHSKQLVTGAVGMVIGFILGFFTFQNLVQDPSGMGEQGSATSAPASSQLPAEHPPEEVMERLLELQSRAETDPQDSQVRITLGDSYYDMGRFDAAIDWYEQALQLEPSNVNVRTDLGTAYLYSGNPVKAVDRYRRSLEIEPAHVQTLQNISVAYLSTGNYVEAVANLEKLLEFHPNYPERQEIEQQIESIRNHMQGDPP